MKARTLYLAQLVLLGSSLTACGKKEEAPGGDDVLPDLLDDCRVLGECEVAPDLDRTVATTLTEAAAFLYTGENPLQRDVEDGAIDPKYVALLRGTVHNADGKALLGAKVSVVGHPEWGWTYSRVDGAFDLAVNGGGRVVVQFEKFGHLPLQRAVQPAWQRHETLPTVALSSRSKKAGQVDSNAKNLQIAEAETVDDSEGARQPLLLFEPGTLATAHLSDGTEEKLDSLNVRISEYPFRDPSESEEDFSATSAGTPSTTGLSYSLGFSVDEAEELGAHAVSFSKPVTFYAENFLELETGSEIPFGFYNPESGTWDEDAPMLVVEVLGSSDGEAQLDLDGDGEAESSDALTDEGISAEELKALASKYKTGQKLWRAEVQHFSEYQGDFPIVPPPTAFAPSVVTPKSRPLATTSRRRMARVESQAVSQTLALAGTPYSLYYQSDRTASFGAAYEIEVPLIGAEVPEGLVDVSVTVHIAGQKMSTKLDPEENLSHTFHWDGRDAQDRQVQGQQRAKIVVKYRYPGEIRVSRRKHSGPGTAIVKNGGRYSSLKQVFEIPVGTWDAGGYEMGGFGLDVLHAYDPVHNTLHFGNGDTKYAENIALVVDRPARTNDLGTPDSIVIAPDGSAIVSEDEGDRLLRIAPDETVTVLGGDGAEGPAEDWDVRSPQGVALKSNGAIWIADFNEASVWEVAPDGKVRAILGKSSIKPLVEANLPKVEGIAFGPSEELYIVSTPNVYRLRGTDLEIFAGGGEGGDGGAATEAKLEVPSGIAVAPDGSVFISERDGHKIRKVSPNGTISTYAGTGVAGFSGDGELAAHAELNEPRGLALSPDGTLYFSDRNNNRIRMVTPDGRIQTLAGGGEKAPEENGQLATQVSIVAPDGIAVAQDGTIWTSAATGLYRVRPGTPNLLAGQTLVPSQDGRTLYRFDSRGKHLETIDAMTGVVELEFTYNKQGFLTQVTDRNKLVTTFERDKKDKLTKVTGPFGQETLLEIDNFELARFTDPLGREKHFTYEDGLLTLTEDAAGGQYGFEYDKQGRLLSISDPTGYKETFKRTNVPGGYSVGVTTASGKSMSFLTQSLPGGTLERSIIDYSGQTRVMEDRIMTQTLYSPDGSSRFTALSPDPSFGPQSTYTAISETNTPGGRTLAVYPLRTKEVEDGENILSVKEWSDLVDMNGRFYETKYNRAKRTLTIITPMGRTQKAVFDEFGNAIESIKTGWAKRSWTYDTFGRPTEHQEGDGDRKQAHTFSDSGFLESLVDALGQKTTYTQDVMGRELSTKFADDSLLALDWDERDNVIGFTPPGKKLHGFSYNDAGLLTASTPPEVNGAAESMGSLSYKYGKDHELTAMQFSDGREIAFRYDAAQRLERTTIGDVRLSYSYDAASRVKAVNRSDSVKLAHSYDGPLWTGDAWTGVVSGEVEADYDDNFWLTSLTVNKASTAHFTHDDDGLVTSCSIRDFALELTRNQDTGLVTNTELDAVSTKQSINEYGEVESLSANGGSTLFSQKLKRDALGRVSSITEVVDGNESEVAYSYDLIGQLTEVDRDGVITKYSYDSNGNRTRIETDGETDIKSTVDEQDRLETYGSWEFSYTETGDLQRRTNGNFNIELQYDELGNLLSAERATEGFQEKLDYKVDGMGRRISRSVNGTFERAWLYQDSLRPVYEVKADGTSSHFVYADQGVGGAPEFMVQDGVPYRFVKDHIGSVRLVVNATNGAIIQQLEYDAFGMVLSDSNPGFQPFGFAGGLYDWNSGLVRFGARDYDASVGRWTAKDLIGFAGLQANVYVYVGNDPVNHTDPTGKAGIMLGWEAFGGIGALAGFSGGIFIGTEGFGTYNTEFGGAGVVGAFGTGIEGGLYWDLEAVQGWGGGVKADSGELGRGGYDLNWSLSDGSFSSFTFGAGAGIGLFVGGTVSHTNTFNVYEWLKQLAIDAYDREVQSRRGRTK